MSDKDLDKPDSASSSDRKPRLAASEIGPFLRSRGSSRFEIVLLLFLATALLLPGIWRYSLVDPWETHYAEVSRRMLQDHDLVHTQWQNEGFRSKPVLTFWMIAGSMRTVGVGKDGGFSGEMTASKAVVFAVRLPFVLFGVMGLVLLWWMLANLISRRVAWMAFLIVGTMPFYFFIARQAITDMPMVGCMVGSVACFAMALEAGDAPLTPIWRRINAFHIFLFAFVLFVGWQLIYYAFYFANAPHLAIRTSSPEIVLPGIMLLGIVGFCLWTIVLQPTRTARQVYMYWFFLLVAVSMLSKGLAAFAPLGAICFFYILLTNSWRQLLKLEIHRGLLLGAIVVVPWHVAMYLVDGRPFIRDYFITHNWNRFFQGVHGERGTFNFFISQIGIGLWPWVAVLPAAVAGFFARVSGQTREGKIRLLIGIWAVVGVAFFAAGQTKFHHYIFPAVPALGIIIAFWFDDLFNGRVRRIGMIAVAAVAIVLLIMRDLMDEQKQFIELFVYRYDRPWPSKGPWEVDLASPLLAFGLVFAVLMVLLSSRTIRRYVFGALVLVAVIFAYWAMNVYMSYAGMHWGQRTAIQTYYEKRQIHGVDIEYYGARQITDEWEHFKNPYVIETVVPEHISPNQPMRIQIDLKDGNCSTRSATLWGRVERIGENRISVAIPDDQLAKVEPLVELGRKRKRPRQKPWRMVNADRLIAWQLYWRGENFWSGDEIWARREDTKTAFKNTDNKEFLNYLKADGRQGKRYFVVTEAGRANNLKNILPTQTAKDTFEIIDRSSNKFTLLSFTL